MTWLRRALAVLLPRFAYGHCLHCWLPWYIAEPYDIAYPVGRSVQVMSFFVCDHCWPRIDLSRRLLYAMVHAEGWSLERHLLWSSALLEAVEVAS